MNKREKYSVIFAGVFISVVIIYQFGIFPFLEKKRLYERKLASKKQIMQEVILLNSEYKKTLDRNENLKKIYSQREKGFTLFAFLEKLSVKAGVDANIDYMKPSSSRDKALKIEFSRVEMKLKKVKMSQLMSYLYLVETSKNVVFVKRLSISLDGKSRKSINAVLNVETVKS